MTNTMYTFGVYSFSQQDGLLIKGTRVHIPRRLRSLLKTLLEANGDVVDLVTLHNCFSRHPIASEVGALKLINLNQNIHWLRKYLNDHDGSTVQTVLKKGYRIGILIERTNDGDSDATYSRNEGPTQRLAHHRLSAPENDKTRFETVASISSMPATERDDRPTFTDVTPEIVITSAITGRLRPADHGSRTVGTMARELDNTSLTPAEVAALGWLKGAILGSIDEGFVHLDEALQAAPDLAIARFYRAWLLIASRRLDAALLELDRGLLGDQRNDRLLFMKGWVLCALGRHGEVDALIARALLMHPNHLMLRVVRSVNLAIGGEHKKARHFLEQSSSTFPHCTLITATISWIDAARGNRHDALHALTKSQPGGPRYTLPTAVAAVYSTLGDSISASAYIKIAEIDQDPWRHLQWCDPRCRQTYGPLSSALPIRTLISEY